MTTNGLQIR